jgi:hypothetical protein
MSPVTSKPIHFGKFLVTSHVKTVPGIIEPQLIIVTGLSHYTVDLRRCQPETSITGPRACVSSASGTAPV